MLVASEIIIRLFGLRTSNLVFKRQVDSDNMGLYKNVFIALQCALSVEGNLDSLILNGPPE